MTTTTVEQIKTQRRFSRTRLPLASGSGTRGWAEHINRLPFSEPFGEDENEHRVPIYITASNKTGRDIEPGVMRTCRKNSDEWTRAEYPWEVTDDSTFKVRGVAGNEFVREGDQVWAPRRGTVTIDRVVYQGDVIYTVFARGSDERITTWFRDERFHVRPAEQEADPMTQGTDGVQVGDHIVVERGPAFGPDHGPYDGKVLVVNEISPSGRPVVSGAGVNIVVDEWIVVKKADSLYPEYGTLIRPREFLPGATYEYKTIAWDRVAVATEAAVGYGGAWLLAMFPEPILGMEAGHRTPIHQWTLVGHKDSKHQHLIDGWQGVKPEVTAVQSGERVDGLTAAEWKAKWDALWVALNEQANRREWCSEYDEFAEENGGPERMNTYEFVVDLEQTIDANVLDEALRAYLSSENATCDIQDSVTVTNRIRFRAETSASQIEEDVTSFVDNWLAGSVYHFDSFEVVEHYED